MRKRRGAGKGGGRREGGRKGGKSGWMTDLGARPVDHTTMPQGSTVPSCRVTDLGVTSAGKLH